jgi:hypothetical protein
MTCPYVSRPSGRAVYSVGMQSLASRSNPAEGMDVCCECCVLSGIRLCGELIARPEESYRLCGVVTRAAAPQEKKIYIYIYPKAKCISISDVS